MGEVPLHHAAGIAPTSFIVVLLTTINSMKQYALIQALNNGGPGTSNNLIVQYIYTTGFQRAQIGYASAASFILMLILMAIALLQLSLNVDGRPEMATTLRPPALRRRTRQPGEVTRSVSASALMWLLVLLYGFPVLWFVLSSFKPAGELFSYPLTLFPHHPTVKGYTDAWTTFDFYRYFANTLIVAIVTTVLTVAASAASGYALAKYDNRWLKVFFVCILATTMLPTEVILSPSFLVVRDLGLYNTLAGVIVPSIITATGVFMFRQYFSTVPDELLEAARIDGSGELSTFVRIMLPIARPIMITLAIFSFQWRWNDYIWPLIVLNNPNQFTLQIALQSIVGAQNVNWSVLLGASVISIVPLVLIYLVFQRYVMSADINAGLKD